jgi:GH24 family phage-related lysozyme (muramidase)
MNQKLGLLMFGTFFAFASYHQLFIVNENKMVINNDNEPIKETIELLAENIEQANNDVPKKMKKKKRGKRKKYTISENGKDFIKRHERCELMAYNDPDERRRSIGWGHQIRPNESHLNAQKITRKKADELFSKDVQWVNDAINRILANADDRFEYSQGFIDGLGSLIYNCGERGVTLTEFYDRLKKCRYDENGVGYINKNDLYYTIAAVKTSRISAKGHIERRYNEHLIMLN